MYLTLLTIANTGVYSKNNYLPIAISYLQSMRCFWHVVCIVLSTRHTLTGDKTMNTSKNMYTLLSIDAWRDECGWTWNNMFTVEEDIYIADTLTNRSLLKFMRRNGWLTDYSKGRVRVEDTGYDIEIQDKNTGEPVFAFRPQFIS